MGILNLLQHKEAGVATPSAKNTALFISESKEGAGENELLAERPAIKLAAGTFLRFILADSRVILGTTAAEATKEETQANGETGIEPSATKAALVTVALKAEEAVSTSWVVEANAVAVQKVIVTPKVGDILPMGTFLVQPGKKIKVTKVTGKLSSVNFSVQLMN